MKRREENIIPYEQSRCPKRAPSAVSQNNSFNRQSPPNDYDLDCYFISLVVKVNILVMTLKFA